MKRMIGIKDVLLIALLVSGIIMSCAKTNSTATIPGTCSTTVPTPLTDSTIKLASQNHYMDTTTGNAMIAKFIANRDSIRNNSLPGQSTVIPMSETFNRTAIQNLLLQDSCVGIKISFGLNDNNQLVTILSAISATGTRMLTPSNPCDNSFPFEPNSFIEHPILNPH